MGKSKATITVDPRKVEEVKRISGINTVSGAIDAALDAMIRRARNEREAAVYRRDPLTGDERVRVRSHSSDLLDDDTDWIAEYGLDGLADPTR